MNRVLIIGPFPEPIYGMSVANQITYEGLKREGINTKFINFKEKSSKVDDQQGKLSFSKLSILIKYAQIYKVIKTDIVYITIGLTYFGILKYLPFILMSKLFRKKLIFHAHGNYLHLEYQELKGFKKRHFKKMLNSFDRGITLTKSLKDNFKDLYPLEKLEVVENFIIEEERNSFIKNNNDKDYSQLRLLFLSNLIKEKGINNLVEALKQLQDEGIFIKTKIAGNIPTHNASILEKIKDLEKAQYLGVIKGSHKINELLESNTFVLPTFYPMEGQPISILEAMSAGNLIITTKHAGIPDFIDESNAIFVEKNDVESLKSALKNLYKNTERIQEIGSNNATYANKKYTENQYLKNLIQAIRF